ncbi:P-loop containing nucleoside triphosphate hydrolase protein [Lojkania enalia]|uniref:P-loop containing nucleoside triphosphate hydrolase protein n=1 Tax=Lojkania enalia TaxID=147567 RepID=A0A9P4K6F8_9PLEO|nr:P-loop containing nucleoside triphosphate hydrolase protein [Didymosphaeria enalia]
MYSQDTSGSDSRSDSDDSSSEDERELRRKKRKAALKKAMKQKAKHKRKKSKKYEFSSDDLSSDSSSDSESDSEAKRKRRKKAKKRRKMKKIEDLSSSSSSSEDEKIPDPPPPGSNTTASNSAVDADIQKLQDEIAKLQLLKAALGSSPPDPTKKDDGKKKKNGKPEYKRVDQVWDSKIRDYKLTETAAEQQDEFDCVFTVRRTFDWEGKHANTYVDVKSKQLRDSLHEIMKDVKGVSLVDDVPSLDPNLLFLYHDEIKEFYRKILKSRLKKEKKKKQQKKLKAQSAHCKLLAGYIEEDYRDIRKKLNPMLKAGNITFDLLWALFKPNTIAFTTTYGSADNPRCFKVDYANKHAHFFKGEWYSIEGRYLEYDGKNFGLGEFEVQVGAFKGVRKITSLATYPLSYHKDVEGVTQKLVERGKKFVELQGMNYRFHKGLAFVKKKNGIGKVNVNGRVMIDPAIFRRLNANYPISYIQRRQDEESDDEESDDEDSELEDECCESEEVEEIKTRIHVFKGRDNKWHVIRVPIDDGSVIPPEKLESMQTKDGEEQVFSEEELLIASSVVLGFSFSYKLWLEFSLSGLKEIEWDGEAFNSLVLPKHTKQNLRGLVSSHRFYAAKTIDDVIQGKGKGLNVVLHGPPGVGKTLTAESIAEYLKAPLYAVSAGELGTNSRTLETELNRIMDITHSWGAILLLDEADVFLEQRANHDVHRNALVSVFLRLLEYYQGILFLTTNRVNTFDEAFQSRIHMGIRYENLNSKARREIWTSYISRVREKMAKEGKGMEGRELSKAEIEELSKKMLNGRQIKNACKTAQSIALAEERAFGIEVLRGVLEVQEDFESDLKGGLGYKDAMRQYT